MARKTALQNLSHVVKQSMNMGYLTPVGIFDVVPGDRIDHSFNAFIRTQPLVTPVMHEVDVDIYAIFVPDRIVWDDAEDFHTGGDDGLATPVAPYQTSPASVGYAVHSLADYYGLPLGEPDMQHSALVMRGYGEIWNTLFRDSQLQAKVTVAKTSGADTTTNKNLLRPCWKRDYFTKCRPAPQLGPDVTIPLELEGNAPVDGIFTNAAPSSALFSGTGPGGVAVSNRYGQIGSNFVVKNTTNTNAAFGPSNPPAIFADLDGISGAEIDIRDIRESSAVQRFLEHNNIWTGAAAYASQLFSRFGIYPQDARLQLPELLGSGSTKFQFSEVLQTAEGTDPVGEMKGHGMGVLSSNRYKYHVKEHGFIHVLMAIRPKTQYMQGLHRMWSRSTKFDYLLPEFEAIGDQAVLNKEIYAKHTSPDTVFGYTPMYDEYRTIPSRVAGDFRDTLKDWHMAREFASDPALNSTFVTANPTDRVFSATNEDQVYITIKHSILARRQLSKEPSYRLM